jgi:photosystem II stability/assembly factor-like uncharacterized protein
LPHRAPGPASSPGAAQPPGEFPADWFGLQRAFPLDHIPQERYLAAAEQAAMERALAPLDDQGPALPWHPAGPFNIGGRVTALAAVPGGPIYLGAAAGGVFKSVNGGANWTPVFDGPLVPSIGALALEPGGGGDVLWVGTGEANTAIDNYDGAGVFRSSDGGRSWEHRGLAETARIARVAVDPQQPSRVFVAAMGRQWTTGPHRGLYRSEDGGANWEQVLFLNDSTGVCDVVIHPANPETVYCATWERVRRLSYRRAYGPSCGIWRSTDHGSTWTRLQNGLPTPSDSVGRIALAIAPSRPSTVYAQIGSGSALGYRGLGLWRSTDGGTSWARRDASGFTGAFGGFVWYFGDMAVHPADPERVFCLGVPLVRSTDGGVTFANVTGSAHVDQHAMWIDPTNPLRVLLGNDGGFYSSTDGGTVWTKSTDLPITQFYAGTVDPTNPARLLGGTQDNNTLITQGSPSGWYAILGGDGFQCLFDPTGPDTIFAEWQNASGGSGPQRSTNGGASFAAPAGFVASDRYNWNAPMAMDPTNSRVLLAGSQRVYRSTDNGRSYAPVSGDLSTSPPALLVYGTLTTLAISPVDPATYYAGTDDGKVWRSTNSGGSWSDVSAGLPSRWVTCVTPDRFDAGTAYVTLSGFGIDEPLAHVYRTTDRGGSWAPIAANLPDAPANDLVVDPVDPLTLYLATDVGVWATRNGGAGWVPLGQGLPPSPVVDLDLHAASRTLVAVTHGRSMWTLDLAGFVAGAATRPFATALSLGPPRPQPSRGRVRLELAASRPGPVRVDVCDVAGRRVRQMSFRVAVAGPISIEWDGADDRGRGVSPGVYFVRAASSGAVATQRVVRAG